MRVLATAAGSFSLAVFAANCIPLGGGAAPAELCPGGAVRRGPSCASVGGHE